MRIKCSAKDCGNIDTRGGNRGKVTKQRQQTPCLSHIS